MSHDKDSTFPRDIAAELDLRDARTLAQVDAPAEGVPDRFDMLVAHDSGLSGDALVSYWDEIGKDEGGFYDNIRQNGCWACGSHTPGCCDACA